METRTTVIDAVNAAIDSGYFSSLRENNFIPANTKEEHKYLYEILPFVEMPANSTFQDIKTQVATNTIIGYKHKLKIGGRCVIAETKYTWRGKVAKTAYLHIWKVNNFEECKVIEHWREQKDGSFKTI